MEFDEVIRSRRSTEASSTSRCPRRDRRVLELAMRAPSFDEHPPWHFHVVAGRVLDGSAPGNVERNLAGIPHSREFRLGPEYAGVHRQRQIDIAKQLFGAMGIARDDKAARQDWVLRGFRQFDAPASIIITYDRALFGGDIAPFDCARWSTAWSTPPGPRMGCVINSQGIMQSPVVRAEAQIPEDQ